jgi:hypothetical protein
MSWSQGLAAGGISTCAPEPFVVRFFTIVVSRLPVSPVVVLPARCG